MTEENNPVDRSKLYQVKIHNLTDRNDILLSAITPSADTQDIGAVTGVLHILSIKRNFV
jgi:hypothetical protein